MILLWMACLIGDLEDEYDALSQDLQDGVESTLASALSDMILKNEQIRDLQNKGLLSTQTSVSGPTDKVVQVKALCGSLKSGLTLTTNVPSSVIVEVSILGTPAMVCSEISDGVLATGADTDVEVVAFSTLGVPTLVKKTMPMNFSFASVKQFTLVDLTPDSMGSLQVVVVKPRGQESEAIQ